MQLEVDKKLLIGLAIETYKFGFLRIFLSKLND